MPGLQGEAVVAAIGSPIKKSKLSLKFFQKKETKRALDFSEPQTEETKPSEPEEPASCDQVVPAPCQTTPILPSERGDTLVPFVGLNNLGNTCYLNSILQVLYYCPGLRDGVKNLYSLSKMRDKLKEEACKSDEAEDAQEASPVHMELLGSFHNLITSVEQLQSSFLLNPDKYTDGELATPPRKLLNTLRQLNPMYEGYLQHDAQEVLQCILGYIQDASETIRKEQQQEEIDEGIEVKPDSAAPVGASRTAEEQPKSSEEDDGQVSGKRKSDTEAGNAKKKPKSLKSKKPAEDSKPLTRSKRRSSNDITLHSAKDEGGEEGEKKKQGEEEEEGEQGGSDGEGKDNEESAQKETDVKRKKRSRLGWLRPSGKQPSIFSKFRSMGRISSHTGGKAEDKPDQDQETPGINLSKENAGEHGKASQEPGALSEGHGEKTAKVEECEGLDLMERLFQGRLVLRTRCLECECYTERREDFQDISVPVQEDEPSSPDCSSDVSPDPKPDLKTLKWAISQFASVERIVGEDKYFCETCHHYTEAERSLLFDKTPEVITIHLKCFSANGLEMDPYAGLSKVNTPLQTPLRLSLEEWCTRPSATRGQHYQLFAVVMHSGVTISSGHYTTYIRMMDLKDTKVRLSEEDEEKEHGEGEEDDDEKEGGGKGQQQSKEEVLDYDDGEVSFSLSGKGKSGAANASSASATNTSKMGAKKSSEGGVGLLGGQRSVSSSYDLGGSSKQANPDKATNAGAESTRAKCTSSAAGHSSSSSSGGGSAGVKKEPGEDGGDEGAKVATEQALSSLLEYEDKWMLFDDSEVRLFDEEDFLKACSPETCFTSTPYLLFYRRVTSQ